MMNKYLIVVALFLVAVQAIPTFKAFSSELEFFEHDNSVGKVTWNYDSTKQAESIVYHRMQVDTVNIRLYSLGLEYMVIEGVCYALPLAEKSMPTPTVRITAMTADKSMVRWVDTTAGPVDSSNFAVPEACGAAQLQGGIFCSACEGIGQKVISLGCNATSAEIANLCGSTFEAICKSVLDQACSGICEIEQCATDVCCIFDLCSGATCNGTNSTSSSSSSGSSTSSQNSIYEVAPTNKNVEGGIFCSSCESVGQSVINLGCNATSSEISNLCGSLFAAVCKTILETACSGVCSIEQCAAQACCLVDLCTGSSCNSTLSTLPRPQQSGVVELNLNL